MKKNKAALTRLAMKSMHSFRDKPKPPPNAAVIEARKAMALAAQDPLAYAFGEPLPGRSALDKLHAKREGRAS